MNQSTELPLTLVSYTDSAFTNAHDVVSPEPKIDGRGTFSHVGVRMEGLESRRHLNFKVKTSESGTWFSRDQKVVNRMEMLVGTGDKTTNRAIVEAIELDTAFFTRNNVSKVYEILFFDELTSTTEATVVATNVDLKGDSALRLPVPNLPVTRIVVTLAEGGLARFKLFGHPAPEQLPPKESLLDNATIFGATDASYGDPSLVLRPARAGKIMAGWETCRHSYRQRLGIALPAESQKAPSKIEVDTYMHCLNSFSAVTVFMCNQPFASVDDLLAALPKWKVNWVDASGKEFSELVADSEVEAFLAKIAEEHFWYTLDASSSACWKEILPVKTLQQDTLHEFVLSSHAEKFTHLMVYGIPDGGIHRFGIY